MQAANGRADLIVRVAGDVFHQEVDQARITLQDREHLKSSVAGAHLGFRLRCGRRFFLGFFCIAKLVRDLTWEFAIRIRC